jgi:aquaporin Z
MRLGTDENATSASAARMLRATPAPDFLKGAHEWRRLFSEAWGTFLLVVVASGAGVVGMLSGGAVTLSMKVVAPGLMVMAIIYFMGSVGGAHLNPAVTLAFAAAAIFRGAACLGTSSRSARAEWRRRVSCGQCSETSRASAPRYPVQV